jgi:uncharacterized membrane protein
MPWVQKDAHWSDAVLGWSNFLLLVIKHNEFPLFRFVQNDIHVVLIISLYMLDQPCIVCDISLIFVVHNRQLTGM